MAAALTNSNDLSLSVSGECRGAERKGHISPGGDERRTYSQQVKTRMFTHQFIAIDLHLITKGKLTLIFAPAHRKLVSDTFINPKN